MTSFFSQSAAVVYRKISPLLQKSIK